MHWGFVRFRKFLNSPDYRFTMVGTTKDLKVLKILGLSCEKFVKIQRQYGVYDSEKNKWKDSLVHLVASIIDPYYRDMKVECDMENSVCHKA
ncbi:hypothetical protein D1007_61752 [Hordeum vulgare]|nr:hypothetical protein D1007_61752 [Hordeum vulgare]